MSDHDLLMNDVHILKFHTGKTYIHVIIIIIIMLLFFILLLLFYYCYNIVVVVVVVAVAQVFQNGVCLKHYMI